MLPKPSQAIAPLPRVWVTRYTLALGGVLLLTACVYMRAIFFDFAYDDFGQIVHNPKIKSWALALTYFHSHVWSQSMEVAFYYRPLYMLWLRVNHALFGLEPAYWHLAAIAIHLTVCLLLYFFVRRLTEDNWVAVVSVLLFGLHPAHVESVAWVSGTTESLLACLLLSSLLFYWKHRDSAQTKPTIWLAASLILALLGVLVKETAIVIPALIFSSEWILYREGAGRKAKFLASFAAVIPYLVVSLGFMVVRTLVLGSLTPPSTKIGRLYVLLAWPEDIAFYLSHALVPFHLSVFYGRLTVPHPGLENFAFPVVLMFGGAIGLFWGSRRSRVFAFLAAWWAILMVPVLNVTLWSNAENLHDRYLYLPSVAVCIALAILLARLKGLGCEKSAWSVLVVIAAGYALVTSLELPYWKNDLVLAQHGIEVSPGHPIAPQVMANALMRDGNIVDAIPYLVESLDAMPANVDSLCSLGYCYWAINALSLAEECVSKAIVVNPSEPQAHLVLGLIRLKQNRLDEAEAECRRGIALQRVPAVTVFHYYLGNILYAKGDVQGAMQEYQMELQNDPAIDPAFAKARQQLTQIER